MEKFFPINIEAQISADFDQMRPLHALKKTHVHGAWDLGIPIGTEILAPEEGWLYYLYQLRSGKKRGHNLFWDDGTWFAFSNYFYDMYGGCAILECPSGLTYLFAHIEGKTIFNEIFEELMQLIYREEIDDRGSIYTWMNWHLPIYIFKGDLIAYSGNAGFSTNPHLHFEIHKKRKYLKYHLRPDPKDIWPEEYKKRFIKEKK